LKALKPSKASILISLAILLAGALVATAVVIAQGKAPPAQAATPATTQEAGGCNGAERTRNGDDGGCEDDVTVCLTNPESDPDCAAPPGCITATGDACPDPTPVPTIDTSACVINGFGNKLCGYDAATYCELMYRQSTLNSSSRKACEDLGWRP
jgi:hypothetical protein